MTSVNHLVRHSRPLHCCTAPAGAACGCAPPPLAHLDVHQAVSTDCPQLPELWCQLLTHRLEEAPYRVTLAHSNLQSATTRDRRCLISATRQGTACRPACCKCFVPAWPHLPSVSAAIPVTVHNLQRFVLDSVLLRQPLLQHTGERRTHTPTPVTLLRTCLCVEQGLDAGAPFATPHQLH